MNPALRDLHVDQRIRLAECGVANVGLTTVAEYPVTRRVTIPFCTGSRDFVITKKTTIPDPLVDGAV